MNETPSDNTRQLLTGRGALSVDETAEVLRIGRSSAYAAIRRGELPSIRIGRRVLVPVPALLAVLGDIHS